MIIYGCILLVGSLISVLAPPRFRFAIALILAISSFVVLPAGLLDIGVVSSIAGVIAGLTFLFLAVATALRPVRVTRTVTALVVLVTIGEVSAMLSTDVNLFAMIIALTAPVGFLVASSLSAVERTMVLWAVVGLAVFEALLCSYEALVVERPLLADVAYGSNPFFAGTIRGQGTLGHPLVAALVMLIGIGCALVLRSGPIAKVPLVVVLTTGVLATGSSSAVIVCAFCLTAAFVIGRGPTRPFKIGFVIVVASLVITGRGFLTSSIGADIGGSNLVHRTNSLIALPRLLTERSLLEAVFGSGWGSAESLYRRNILINDGFYAIDNQVTTIVAATGLAGVALFLGILVVVFREARGPLRVTLLTILIMSLSFDVLSWVATSSLFWFVASCALSEPTGPALHQPAGHGRSWSPSASSEGVSPVRGRSRSPSGAAATRLSAAPSTRHRQSSGIGATEPGG